MNKYIINKNYNQYLSKNALSFTFLHIKSKNNLLAFFLAPCPIIVFNNFSQVFELNIHISFILLKISASIISARI
jgi:hypothetical protein